MQSLLCGVLGATYLQKPQVTSATSSATSVANLPPIEKLLRSGRILKQPVWLGGANSTHANAKKEWSDEMGKCH
jgi:hypothetical protein